MAYDDPINGKHYSAGQKAEAGITGYEQDWEASNKMKQYELKQAQITTPEFHFNPTGKKVYKWEYYAIIGFILCIPIFGWNLISKDQYSPKYQAENQVKEGLVTRSQYVQNVDLTDKYVKLGLNKDGTLKSTPEIIQDYKNVLTGVLPPSVLNNIIANLKGPSPSLYSTEKLRIMATRYNTAEQFDDNFAYKFLDKLYYDPTHPEQKYHFIYKNLYSTECDVNNVCMKGQVYHNVYYNLN